MNLGLEGRVAVVAAASRGLGHAIALELATEGASVCMCARSPDTLEAARAAIAATTGAEVEAVAADVSELSGIKLLADHALAHFGRVDILVTNAGGPPAGTFEAHAWPAWERAVQLTLRSAVELTRAVLPGMKERHWGRIIHVNSIAAKQPVENLMLSNSIRAAVAGFARTLANEVATFGVTVNSVLPGYTRTERVESLAQSTGAKEGIAPAEVSARFEREIPMRRLGDPRELAALVAFLASERAGYTTGQSIAVDGGWIRALM